MREFFKVELNESTNSDRVKSSISNILTGLLCAFQIIDIGAGAAFNVDEKDFIDALYAVSQKIFEQQKHFVLENKDFIAFVKSMDIVFCKRKQLSAEIVNAFVKRLALL